MENYGAATALTAVTVREGAWLDSSQDGNNNFGTQWGRLNVSGVGSVEPTIKLASGTSRSNGPDLFSAKPVQAEANLSVTDTHFSSGSLKILEAKNVMDALKELNLKSIEKELGGGTFGVVHEWTAEGDKTLAVKSIKPKKYQTKATGLEKGEVCALDFGTHENLVTVHTILLKKKNTDSYAAIESRKPLTDSIKQDYHLAAIISDKAAGTELRNLLNDEHFQRTNQFVANVGMRVADALGCLHKKGMVYRDIKPENIIYDIIKNI